MQTEETRQCPACGRENRASSRFCANCGAPLAPTASEAERQEPSAPNSYLVRSWDDTGGHEPSPTVTAPAGEPEPGEQPGRYIPPPPPQAQPMREELPPWSPRRGGAYAAPIEMARRRDPRGVYLPYADAAAKQLQPEKARQGWLVPFLIVTSAILAALLVATGYLLFTPARAASESPTACRVPANATEEDQVKFTVCRSNEEQSRSSRDLTTRNLSQVFTGKELQKNVEQIQEFRARGIIAETKNSRLDFTEVRVRGSSATVRTVEVWSVAFYSKADNRLLMQDGPSTSAQVYWLVKQDGKWLVEVVEESGDTTTQ